MIEVLHPTINRPKIVPISFTPFYIIFLLSLVFVNYSFCSKSWVIGSRKITRVFSGTDDLLSSKLILMYLLIVKISSQVVNFNLTKIYSLISSQHSQNYCHVKFILMSIRESVLLSEYWFYSGCP